MQHRDQMSENSAYNPTSDATLEHARTVRPRNGASSADDSEESIAGIFGHQVVTVSKSTNPSTDSNAGVDFGQQQRDGMTTRPSNRKQKKNKKSTSLISRIIRLSLIALSCFMAGRIYGVLQDPSFPSVWENGFDIFQLLSNVHEHLGTRGGAHYAQKHTLQRNYLKVLNDDALAGLSQDFADSMTIIKKLLGHVIVDLDARLEEQVEISKELARRVNSVQLTGENGATQTGLDRDRPEQTRTDQDNSEQSGEASEISFIQRTGQSVMSTDPGVITRLVANTQEGLSPVDFQPPNKEVVGGAKELWKKLWTQKKGGEEIMDAAVKLYERDIISAKEAIDAWLSQIPIHIREIKSNIQDMAKKSLSETVNREHRKLQDAQIAYEDYVSNADELGVTGEDLGLTLVNGLFGLQVQIWDANLVMLRDQKFKCGSEWKLQPIQGGYYFQGSLRGGVFMKKIIGGSEDELGPRPARYFSNGYEAPRYGEVGNKMGIPWREFRDPPRCGDFYPDERVYIGFQDLSVTHRVGDAPEYHDHKIPNTEMDFVKCQGIGQGFMRPNLDSFGFSLALTKAIFLSPEDTGYHSADLSPIKKSADEHGMRESQFYFNRAIDVGSGSGFLAQSLANRILFGVTHDLLPNFREKFTMLEELTEENKANAFEFHDEIFQWNGGSPLIDALDIDEHAVEFMEDISRSRLPPKLVRPVKGDALLWDYSPYDMMLCNPPYIPTLDEITNNVIHTFDDGSVNFFAGIGLIVKLLEDVLFRRPGMKMVLSFSSTSLCSQRVREVFGKFQSQRVKATPLYQEEVLFVAEAFDRGVFEKPNYSVSREDSYCYRQFGGGREFSVSSTSTSTFDLPVGTTHDVGRSDKRSGTKPEGGSWHFVIVLFLENSFSINFW